MQKEDLELSSAEWHYLETFVYVLRRAIKNREPKTAADCACSIWSAFDGRYLTSEVEKDEFAMHNPMGSR